MASARQLAGEQNKKAGKSDPLTFAVASRDKDVLRYVREALNNDQAMLAFQPIVHANGENTTAFFEGLIRIMDHTGRIIPAKDFVEFVEKPNSAEKLTVLR